MEIILTEVESSIQHEQWWKILITFLISKYCKLSIWISKIPKEWNGYIEFYFSNIVYLVGAQNLEELLNKKIG